MSENNKKKVENSNVDQEIDEKIQFTEEKQNSLEEKLKESEDKLLRSLAEIENQRRRFEKERQEAFEFGGFNLAKESLAVLDNIDRAVISFKNDEILKKNIDLDKIVNGIEIVKKDLETIFKKNGVEPIECMNKKFDPNFHQAMLEVEDDTKDSGIVVQEIQKGYMMKDRLLRPSMVGVAKKNDKK